MGGDSENGGGETHYQLLLRQGDARIVLEELTLARVVHLHLAQPTKHIPSTVPFLLSLLPAPIGDRRF